MSPQKDIWKSWVSHNVTLFGDKVFTEVITLNGVTRLDPNPI